MMLDYKIGYFLGSPVYINISVSICFIYFMVRYGLFTGFISSISFIFLMLVHEMGHAWYVKKYRHYLVCIKLGLIHGSCEYEHDERYTPETMILAGGLYFQAILFGVSLLTLGALSFLNIYQIKFIYEPVLFIFIYINAIIFVINALPIPGLDGYDLWLRFRTAYTKKVRAYKKKADNNISTEKVVDLAIKRAQKKSKHNN